MVVTEFIIKKGRDVIFFGLENNGMAGTCTCI